LEVIPAKDIRSFTPSCSRGDRTRYFLKIQDGCDCWCSYCAIPAARGRSRSGTIAQMVEQAEKVAAEGGKEIVITGVNIGDFGKRQPDLPADAPREDFLGLIKALDKVEGIERYRISSIEPDLLTDEIIDFCSKSRAFMPHFHIPLQCGSDEVLRLMRRRYDTALFRDKIHRIKQLIPHAFIGIDLICGARGETPEEFKRSREFIESLPITRLHIFPYSERPGTRALEIPYVVEQAEKHRRVEEMTEVSNRMLREFSEQFLGDVRPVLMEHSRPGQPMAGFTDNYLKVRVANAPAELDNQIVNVRLTEIVTNPTTNEVEFLGEYQ
jgi:threonylcarbamoyladenosine tRNA methylthiotransferase MtaB